MLQSSGHNPRRQFPSNQTVEEMIAKSPYLLKTHFAYFLSIVLKNNDTQLLDFLLQQEGSFKQKGLKEFILQCTELGRLKIIDHLLLKGITPNVQNDDGETLFHIAARKGDVEMAKLLLAYQANCSLLSKDNLSAYDYAVEQGSKKVIDLLKKHKSHSMIIKGSFQENCALTESITAGDPYCNKRQDYPYQIKAYHYRTPQSERNGAYFVKKPANSDYFKDLSMPFTVLYSTKNDISEDGALQYNLCEKSQVVVNDVKQFYTIKKLAKSDEEIDQLSREDVFPLCNDKKININTINQVLNHFNGSNEYPLASNAHQFIREEEDIVQQELPSKKPSLKGSQVCYRTMQTTSNQNGIEAELYLPHQYYSHQPQEVDIQPLCSAIYSQHLELPVHTDNELILTDKRKEVLEFLSEIHLGEYTHLLITNGFDDITLIIEQTKLSIAITDDNLRDAGISLPGDRAKILVRLEEKAKLFDFDFTKLNLYYKPDKSAMNKSDRQKQNLHRFLSTIKMETYLNHFISAGYTSYELILIQMISRQPFTEYTLQYEIGIDKIGYRARMLNKFREEAKSFVSRVKNGNALIESQKGQSDFCNGCFIF